MSRSPVRLRASSVVAATLVSVATPVDVASRHDGTFPGAAPFAAAEALAQGNGPRTARPRASGGEAVRDAVRELEDAEARLRGGVYQFPLPDAKAGQGPDASDAKAAASTASNAASNAASDSPSAGKSGAVGTGARQRPSNEPMGIDILPDEETGEESSRALGEIAARLSAVQARASDVRARILKLQDEMAARLDDVGLARVALVVEEPAPAQSSGSPGSPSGDASRWPLAVHELTASLDGIPLVSRLQPRRVEKDARLSLYEGPLPAGEYELRVRVVIGLLSAGWPSTLGQGRWLVEKSLRFRHEPARAKGPAVWTVVLAPEKGNVRPTLSIRAAEVRR